MTQETRLEKTNRINLLFAFYERLLTEKQQTFLKYYFHDDFSLGEIAAEFEISRQAVYEHIKRAEQTLENYEAKLELLRRHESRMHEIRELEALSHNDKLPEETRRELGAIAGKLQALE
ncbi:YlxM family DNA-binding protein [Saccharibacillus alkalitolerans]|uniref:UPF0122 protein GYN08_09405 n=1 Tax=Saccharibacillus alkalitolerans TaxID=2705290 RepID=A0ABX0F587_9BACL|nr:YlxM family DNA-binding protein [Saccharibacillus alkalitolerans]NGZ75538.1 YlxM family DNA-binding protein [Saccharibacillus alkalitolerans]